MKFSLLQRLPFDIFKNLESSGLRLNDVRKQKSCVTVMIRQQFLSRDSTHDTAPQAKKEIYDFLIVFMLG